MTGRKFAYVGVIVGLTLSMGANVMHAMQPGAPWWAPWLSGMWPVLLFLALEILTRGKFGAGRRRTMARIGVLVVAAVAAVLSYWHLRGLLEQAGEQALAWVGPLAIDGLMVVSAAALLDDETTSPAVPVSVPERTSPALGDSDPLMVEPARPSVAAARHDPPKVTSRARPKPPTSRKPTDDDLAALARAAIATGDLPAIPSNNAIRVRYGINNARAVRVIDRATASMEATS